MNKWVALLGGTCTLLLAFPAAAQEFKAFDEVSELSSADTQENRREQRFLLHSSWLGSVGGIHVLDARSGPQGSFRIQLGANFFFTNDFLVQGDEHDQVGGVLSFSWTPLEFLELFGAMLGYSNSNPMEAPSLFQVVGDTHIGVKSFIDINRWLTFGGDLRAILLNSVGDVGLSMESTSMALGANLTADFRNFKQVFPLIARLNVRYHWDNSAELVEDVERARYNALPDPAGNPDNEYRHLISRIERFSLNINRIDRLDTSVGVEAPLQVSDDFHINPIAEWSLGLPVNRQNYSCLFVAQTANSDQPLGEEDGCLTKNGFTSFPMVLSLGVRFLPPVEGLSAMAAVDIGLQGTSDFVREFSPVAPYNVLLSVAYAYDTQRITDTSVVQPRAVVQRRPTPSTKIRGRVLDATEGSPIANARIDFGRPDVSVVLSQQDGSFISYPFPEGEQVFMRITAEGYKEGRCSAMVPKADNAEEVKCPLEPLAPQASLQGVVKNEDGAGLAGVALVLKGPSEQQISSDEQGGFAFQDLEAGDYLLRASLDKYLIHQERFTVEDRGNKQIAITLKAEPKRSLVKVTKRQIRLRRQIHFDSGSSNIALDSMALMEQLADVLLRQPEIKRVEIQGHTDNVGGAALNKRLSQERADAVRTWLIQEGGIASDRLLAKGYGMEQPLVPNITRENRARNRRVQFEILEREESAENNSEP